MDIFWLDNVRYEIRQMRGKAGPEKLPDAQHCRFFYPQLDRHANIRPTKAKAATVEMLTSPWIILEYEKGGRVGIVVFYRRNGESENEFIYLLDYLRHYQVLRADTDVSIRTLDTVPTAQATFQKAQQRYIAELGTEEGSELGRRVKAIRYAKMTQVVTTFSTDEIGMDYA